MNTLLVILGFIVILLIVVGATLIEKYFNKIEFEKRKVERQIKDITPTIPLYWLNKKRKIRK